MFGDKTILAVVPARSGSKGIPDKNMKLLRGVSLIGHAGRCLQELLWIDAKIISTDSLRYAEEGRKYGLDCFFLRSADLSTDFASAVDTVSHALLQSELHYGKWFDVVLIIEPTSPFRQASDIESTVRLLADTGADSVVAVSELTTKAHPRKVLKIESARITFYEADGAGVVARQSLETLYWRNGICYALTRNCLLEQKKIFTDNTMPLVIDREIVNIDDPIDFEWAEFLMQRGLTTKRK